MTTGQPAVLTILTCLLSVVWVHILSGINQNGLTSSLGPQPPSTSEPSAPEIPTLEPQPSGPDVISTQPDPTTANVVSTQPDPTTANDVVSPYPQPNTDALRKFISAYITLQKLLN